MAPYQYPPLNENLNEIRVLELQTGDFSADLRVSIRKVTLTPDTPPFYEALSYVWGTTDNKIDIKVGPPENDTLAITQNLAIALPYLRYKDRVRTFWIDAICINQDDVDERSRQVKRMGDIYRFADRVVVWLGPEDDDSGHVLKILSQLSSEIKVDYASRTMSPASSDSDPTWRDTRSLLPFSSDEVQSVESLLNRPWFSRLWVWQEILLSGNNAIVVCGSCTILWQSLRQTIVCLNSKRFSPSIDTSQLQARLIYILNMSSFDIYASFGGIIWRTAACKCSDPKDRVYAVLSLLRKWEKDINIEPDYTKTTAQVYQDAVLQHIKHSRTLEMLAFCELKNDRPAEMPTWVPNWAAIDSAQPLEHQGSACSYSSANAQYKGRGVLSAAGVVAATVLSAEEYISQKKKEGVVDEIRRLAPRNVEHSSYVAGGSLIDAFCSIMCVNLFSDLTRPRQEGFPQLDESREFVLAILQAKDWLSRTAIGSTQSRYLDYVWAFCNKRSFIMTEEGYIGLAPKLTKPGDQVCILLGCTRPLVLRQTSGLQYQVVGECYVHGLMNGEAFLGSLPDNYQARFLYDQGSNGWYRAFLDKETGNTQYQDPRMEAGDQIVNQGRSMILPDGTIVPEVTSEFLKRRGVNVQTFDLI
ncbi:hypothetical protein IMSHALPRED_007032 [Imshaugia aleurites]|uniref:Heterokaryon incompatibility domain-containing protein n=1 Tax=Imshaugia aleurites TaxID=172621 RepID=A0A8H3FLG8_9LECA|nr:hypothetical protein IMSHALPRED_007032 [Imshaugia aleurites]